MGKGSWIRRSGRFKFACLGVMVALVAVAAVAGSATPAPPPVVMTDVCVNPSHGQMSFPIGGTCPAGHALVAVDDPGATFAACFLQSNGAIRKLPAGSQCTSAPRSKKETEVTVPSLTGDLYLCASNSGGALFFKGTSPVTCKSGQFLVVIEQANTPPVASDQSVSVNEDGSVLITLSASDADGQNLSSASLSGQGPSHGLLSPLVPLHLLHGDGDVHAGCELLRPGLVQVPGERRLRQLERRDGLDHGHRRQRRAELHRGRGSDGERGCRRADACTTGRRDQLPGPPNETGRRSRSRVSNDNSALFSVASRRSRRRAR